MAEEKVVTKAPYVPGGDKRPFLRGGPGGQGGHFNPHIPDFVPDPSVTNPGGQGYNPGSNGGQGSIGGQGYNPGYNGGQGYNPGNNGGQGYNPGSNRGQGYNPGSNGGYNSGNNGGQGYNPGNNGGQGYNPGGYNPGGRNDDDIHFPAGNGIGGRGQFRTPIVFADEEDSSEDESKPTFQAVGVLGGPQASARAQQGVNTFPSFPTRLPARKPYVPGQDKTPLLRGPPEIYVQELGAPGGPWDGKTVALLLQPKDFNPTIQTGAVQTLPSPIQFAETPQFRKLSPSPAQFNPQIQAGRAQTLPSPIQFADAQFNPQFQSGLAQTLPSPIQFAKESPKVLILQPVTKQLLGGGPQIQGRAPGAQQGVQTLPSPIQFAGERPSYVPGSDKSPHLRPASFSPQIQAGVAEPLPSRGIQFADDALPYLAGSDKRPYLGTQQEPKVIVVPGNEGSERRTSLPAQDGTSPYPGIPFPYFRKAESPPFRASPTVIYIF